LNARATDFVYCAHRAGHAIHVDAGRIGRRPADKSGVPVLGLKLQFSPARDDPGAQTERVAKLHRRGQSLVRGLPIDAWNPGEGEKELGTLLQRHVTPRSRERRASPRIFPGRNRVSETPTLNTGGSA
jgi:hypothetical protein